MQMERFNMEENGATAATTCLGLRGGRTSIYFGASVFNFYYIAAKKSSGLNG